MNFSPILVDNNALADFFVGETGLRRDAQNLRLKFPDWFVPPLWRYEFGNVLRTYVRRGFVTEADARLMLSQAIGMVKICSECTEEVILAEANARSLTFYDATYTACARWLGYPLYTRDGNILKNCSDIAHAISNA